MSVNGEMICWEGRITNAVLKADNLIKTGKLSKEQVNAIITDFEQKFDDAVANAVKARDEYWCICKKTGVEPQTYTRPACPCPLCAERIRHQAAEEARRAVMTVIETEFDNAAVNLAKQLIQYCKQQNITVEWGLT